jgi:asparagine synthase (glutamine-hydrolysing)
MSVQYGKCNFDGKPVDPGDLGEVRPVLAPYGPDGEGYSCKENFGVLYRALHTTTESCRETQPYISESGMVITWDGRLDNREEWINQLPAGLSRESADVEIVAAALEREGTAAFRNLIGDWALSIWDPKDRSLILAKDFIGTRHLYYSAEKDEVTWCTILDPLVLFARRPFKVEEEYIAGWFSFLPAPHLTPYAGIHSVPPSSFVQLKKGTRWISKYWDFDPRSRIRYRTDGEYEEHFRFAFSEAVRRRLRSNCPVLAELSGGIDSSSIVCIADILIAGERAETPRLDTVSYYNDSEPNWNERPYFTKVEEKRGRTGCQIDVGSHYSLEFECDHFAATPGARGSRNEAARQFAEYMTSQGSRTVLSGTGGDEVTGGVPTPAPELEDFIARGDFRALAHQLKRWALDKKKPWLHLFFEAARAFLPPRLAGDRRCKPAPWLNANFIERNSSVLQGYPKRTRIFGPLPSFQENVVTLAGLERQLGCGALASDPPYETRYPYLDRSLLEFTYAIPRSQLVRPGQRRSLMRRALVGIVPEALLNRRRKAFVVRGPMAAISAEWPALVEMTQHMISSALGVVDAAAFLETLQMARAGRGVRTNTLIRTIAIECWLRSLGPSLAREVESLNRPGLPWRKNRGLRKVFSSSGAERNTNQ